VRVYVDVDVHYTVGHRSWFVLPPVVPSSFLSLWVLTVLHVFPLLLFLLRLITLLEVLLERRSPHDLLGLLLSLASTLLPLSLVPALVVLAVEILLWVKFRFILVILYIQRRIILDQLAVDFKADFVGLAKAHDIRLDFSEELGEGRLYRYLKSLLNNVVTVLIHEVLVEGVSAGHNLVYHLGFSLSGGVLQAFLDDIGRELFHTQK